MQELLKLLIDAPQGLSAQQIALRLNRSPRTMLRQLKQLTEAKHIHFSG